MSIHSTAIIDPRAEIAPDVQIGPYVVIDGPVRVGPGCKIDPAAILMGHTEIGARCHIHAHAVVGDLPQDRAFHGEVSFCKIGDDCIIREGSTVHRGTKPGTTTTIGDRCMLMTNSHVGHNCTVGNDVTLVSGVLLGGYVTMGDKSMIGGGAAVHQFVRIGELAMVAGITAAVRDVPPFAMTDRTGTVVGLNVVGLRRAGLTSQERNELKQAFKIVYHSGLPREQWLAALGGLTTTPACQKLLDFLTPESTRGVTKPSLRLSDAA